MRDRCDVTDLLIKHRFCESTIKCIRTVPAKGVSCVQNWQNDSYTAVGTV